MRDNDGLSFTACFGGKPYSIYSPIGAVLALYASESGEGLSFEPEDNDNLPPDDNPPAGDGSKNKNSKKSEKPTQRPSLKVVK